MKKQLLTLLIIISFSAAFGQVGINTTNPQAQLDIRSSNQAVPSNTDGILIPKVDVFPATNPTTAQNGMMVFLTTTIGIKPPGFYYWDSTTSSWIGLAASTSGWALIGNSGTVAGTNFIGTTDNQGLDFRTNNTIRGRFTSAGFLGIGTTTPNQQLELTENFRLPLTTSTTGIIYAGTFRFAHNLGGTYFGTNAGNLATTSSWNTGIGQNVMQSQTTGNYNVGVGANALASSTGGFSNSAIGYQALNGLTTGGDNTAMGSGVMRSLTTGSRNIAIGSQAMIGLATNSSDNVAMGYGALAGNGTSFFNTAIGGAALNTTSTGSNNTAIGRSSMQLNTTGSRNTALGYNSLFSGLTTTNNTAIGHEAGRDVTGSGNVMLGYQAGYSEAGNNKLYIDNSNTVSPLVYGDFSTNLLRVNGTLNINNTYSFPTTDGTVGQVLTTNGAGAVTWGAVVPAESDPNAWLKTGNAGTSAATNFIGTTDNNALVVKTNSVEALRVTENGDMGIGITTPSQQLEITKNFQLPNSTATTGIIFSGGSRFIHNYGSTRNFFAGVNAGNFAMTGLSNTGIGYNALTGNSTGENNTALGRSALGSNSTGNWNVGIGYYALQQNQTGGGNIAVGTLSMASHTTNDSNIAIGNHALYGDVSGTSNVGVGVGSLFSNQTGTNNVAFGTSAGHNTTGSGNIFLGSNAGYNETGSDKLYIDNNNTANPLVYGDFGTDLLRVNGTLNINNTYSLPTTDGTAGQTLSTDGAGVVSWSNGATDNMGNHTATQNVLLNNNYLSNDGDNEGIVIDNGGNVGVGTATPSSRLHIKGDQIIESGTLYMNSLDNTEKILLTDWGDNGSKINTSQNFTIDFIAGSNGWDTDGNHRFFTSVIGVGRTERMCISSNGNIGIGSTNPTQAKLVINGTENNTLSYGYLMSNGTVGTSSGTSGYSLYASGRIAATEFNAFSDERIKNIKGISNSSKDLETLNKIQITNYTFKDSIGKGTGMSKKVIAQQVEKVYPQAVSTITDVVPDIYTVAKIKDGRVILKNTLQKGDRVRLVFDSRTEIVDVLQADEYGFNVSVKDEGKVFVFGREVTDFHTVDYEALSTLNISATQELLKMINQQEAQIRDLKDEMNKRLSHTEAELQQIKSMFNSSVSSSK